MAGSMDTAKGVNIPVSENAEDLMKFSGAGALKRALKPLVVIPATAGTGSEAMLVAVVKGQERHLKMAFVSYFLLPDVAILDSRMTLALPPPLSRRRPPWTPWHTPLMPIPVSPRTP